MGGTAKLTMIITALLMIFFPRWGLIVGGFVIFGVVIVAILGFFFGFVVHSNAWNG